MCQCEACIPTIKTYNLRVTAAIVLNSDQQELLGGGGLFLTDIVHDCRHMVIKKKQTNLLGFIIISESLCTCTKGSLLSLPTLEIPQKLRKSTL